MLNCKYKLQSEWTAELKEQIFIKWDPFPNFTCISIYITHPLTNQILYCVISPFCSLCMILSISTSWIEFRSNNTEWNTSSGVLLSLAEIISSSCCDLTYKYIWFTTPAWTIIPSRPIPSSKAWQKIHISIPVQSCNSPNGAKIPFFISAAISWCSQEGNLIFPFYLCMS